MKKKKIKSYNINQKRINHKKWFVFLIIAEAIVFYCCSKVESPSGMNPTPLGMVIMLFIWFIQYAKAIDKASKKYMPGKEMGSAKWEDVERFNEKFKSPKEDENMILTRNARKMYDKKTLLNNNVVTVGGSGAGKTAGFVGPNLLQFYGSNIYIDPKGDTLKTFGPALKKKKIPIKVLDLCEMLLSFQYNPFKYITEEVHIDQLINNIIANTTEKEAKSGTDPFWEKAEILCEKSLFFYVWLECPQDYCKCTQNPINDESEVMIVSGRQIYKTPIYDIHGKPMRLTQTLRSVLLLLGEAEVKEDDDELSDLDCRMMVLAEKLRQEKKLPEQHKAIDNYNRVMRGAKDTVRSVVMSVNARFVNFQNEKILRIFDDDELELETIGTKQQALFLKIPDEDTTYNFVVGMLYTQLFQTLYRVARFYDNVLPVPVGIWADEFANVKMPHDFEKILATCRSRNIYIVIIVQSLAQLKTLYPNDAYEGLIGNCDTFVYLGGNEKSSQKYVSELLGKWTIDKKTDNQTLGRQGSTSINNDLLGRELMTEDEVSMLPNDECIVKVRSVYPIRDKKCYWFQIPEYDYVKALPPYESNIVVQEENGRYITVKYQAPFKVYQEEELKRLEERGTVKMQKIHPVDLLMYDLIQDEIKAEQEDEFEKLALAMYEELDVQEMDEQIERAREVQQRKSEKDMLQQIMEQDFSDEQMEVILEALNEKLPLKEIMKFALPEKSPTQMKFMKKLVQE